MNYVEQGKGFPVVFLHGWGGSTESFGYIAGSLRRTHRTIRVDMAGFGLTPPPKSAWGAQEYAEDLRQLLVKLGLKECVLVCHSFGGRVGIELAATSPALVRGLVLVDSAGIRPRLSLRKRLSIRRYKRAKARGQLTGGGSVDYHACEDALRPTFVKVVNEDLSDKLSLITAPTLLIWGRDDKETPPKMAKKMQKEIQGSTLLWLEGGHFAYIDEGITFVRILDSYLREVTK